MPFKAVVPKFTIWLVDAVVISSNLTALSTPSGDVVALLVVVMLALIPAQPPAYSLESTKFVLLGSSKRYGLATPVV